jgi:hypothetical protein
MARSEEGVDLRIKARVAGSGGRWVTHGWALLRQADDLRNVANAG